MTEYHKIQTVFKRNQDNKFKTLIEGDYSLPEFEYLKNNEWIFTEKIDGTNIRIFFDETNVKFGGRTSNASIPSPLLNTLISKFSTKVMKEMLINKFKDHSVCLYGEGFGAGIQKGGIYNKNQDFILFDIKIGNWWLKREDIEDIAQYLNIQIVPILGIGTLLDMVNIVKNGLISQWGDFNAEGIVARPKIELKTRAGNRIITKLKHKDFS